MKNTRRAAAFLATLTLALSGLGLEASTAQAAPYSCRDRQLCAYTGENATGSVFVITDTRDGYPCDMDFSDNKFANGTPVKNRVASMVNKTDSLMFVSDKTWLSGQLGMVFVDATVNLSHIRMGDKYGNLAGTAASAC
ncbi:peptidase inhibitor family I36 protein [Micromonospora sp. ALFpr18c]|uniref:peptidase inhibitor family I36 protein n=1 Tax=unclassified Micromonospora TaxID=2617518 RepID=UPI001788B066|nr:peptidase inhibitor family I36 protein [Micromonospora sp. ALFpr18c]